MNSVGWEVLQGLFPCGRYTLGRLKVWNSLHELLGRDTHRDLEGLGAGDRIV